MAGYLTVFIIAISHCVSLGLAENMYDCEKSDMRFIVNSSDFKVSMNCTRNLEIEIDFQNSPFVLVGLINILDDPVILNISTDSTEQVVKSYTINRKLFFFEEPLYVDGILYIVTMANINAFCDNINMIFIGCDSFNYTCEDDESMTHSDSSITSMYTSTRSSSSSCTVTYTTECNSPRGCTVLKSTSHPATSFNVSPSTWSSDYGSQSRNDCSQNLTSNATSSTSSCSQITYIIVIPVVIMLLLNVIAFSVLLIFVVKKKGKKKSAFRNQVSTLREVPNESLYAISSFEDKRKSSLDKGQEYTTNNEDLYSPVFDSLPRNISASVIDTKYRSLRFSDPKYRPNSLPIIRQVLNSDHTTRESNYSEVSPYLSPTNIRNTEVKNQLESKVVDSITSSVVKENGDETAE